MENTALAVHQLGIKVIAFQWVFAFVIMSVLFLATLAIAIPELFPVKESGRPQADADHERQPLLDDH